MIYEELKVSMAAGSILLNNIKTDLGVLNKGHKISNEDIVMLQVMGIEKIMVAKVEDGDMAQRTAQEVISSRLCGKNATYFVDGEGVVRIAATEDGFFVSDESRIQKFNNMNSNIILNTIPLFTYVKSGEIIAKIEFCVPLYYEKHINDIVFNLTGNIEMLSVAEIDRKKAGVVFTEFYKDSNEKKHFNETLSKLKIRLKNVNLEFFREAYAEHHVHFVADEIENARDAGCDYIFIISSVRTSGQNDVIPSAIKSIVDEKFVSNIQNVNISDFIIGGAKDVRIINIPFNYANVDSEIIDEMILKSLVIEKLSPSDFEYKNPLLLYTGEKVSPEEQNKINSKSQKNAKKSVIAIIILSGGYSTRVGYNKLLFSINGEPIFLRSVKEAIKAEIGPVYLVTGYQAQLFEKELNNIDVNVINNLSFRDGVKSSIKLAINHIPNYCDGVIILPADMPKVSAKHLNKMVRKLDRRKNKQVIISCYNNIKYNPVLWSKEIMNSAELVPENSYMRPTFVEYEDYTTLVEFDNEEEILDVDYPADIETLVKNR